VQDYHQLEIWRRGMDFTVQVYEFSTQLPTDERFNLASQLKRAAVSVPLNIAEGCGCSTDGEFARFLSYAYRSLKEVVTCLELIERLHPALREPTHRTGARMITNASVPQTHNSRLTTHN
jgi:four helix bundle protein